MPPQPDLVQVPSIEVPVASVSGSASAAPAPPPTETIEGLSSPACQWKHAAGLLVAPIDLEAGGRRVGSIDGNIESIEVRVAEDFAHATARISTASMRIQTEVDPSTIRVTLRSGAPLVDDWIEPFSAPVLGVLPGKVKLAISLPHGVRARNTQPPAQVDCADVSLTRVARTVFGRLMVLKAGARGELRRTPAGDVVATISGPPLPRPGEPEQLYWITELERKNDKVRVRFEGGDTAVQGWTDKKVITPMQSSVFGMMGAGTGGPPSHVTCSRDTPLLLESDHRIYKIGELRAGARVPGEKRADSRFRVIIEADSGSLFGGLGMQSPSTRKLPAGEVYVEGDGCSLAEARPQSGP
jgi:hypothetical protein